ncbi:MAG: hypothetical protein IID44_28635 [Planctomycetes bacterium]|nr:hypothetical protein [Planctomycetota bacterium]
MSLQADRYAAGYNCKRRAKRGPKAVPQPTAGARRLEKALKFRAMEREMAELRRFLDRVVALVDPDILAAAEIERICPSNAELRVWASESTPPEDLDQQQEERPW